LENLQAAGRVLYKRRDEWDILKFDCLAEDGLSLHNVSSAFKDGGLWVDYNIPWQVAPFVSLEESWENYFKGRSHNLRKNVKWLLNKWDRKGKVEFLVLSGGDATNAMEEVFSLRDEGWWLERGKTSTARLNNLLVNLWRASIPDHEFVVYKMMVARNTVAAAACSIDHKNARMCYRYPTFRREFADLSPGKILLYYIIRDAFAKGLKEVDLGRGGTPYKYYWATGERTIYRFVVFSRSSLAGPHKLIIQPTKQLFLRKKTNQVP
jgi:CelD/BcsL family acetyltransferase involved in cellulose biosynthesis